MKLLKDDILYQISQFHGVSVSVGRWVSVEKMLLELFSQQPWQQPLQMRTERMKQRFGVPSAINASYDLYKKHCFFSVFSYIFGGLKRQLNAQLCQIFFEMHTLESHLTEGLWRLFRTEEESGNLRIFGGKLLVVCWKILKI